MTINEAIRAKFPEPANDAERLLQRDTMNALAGLMCDAADRLESKSPYMHVADLRREAETLRNYAASLISSDPEVKP